MAVVFFLRKDLFWPISDGFGIVLGKNHFGVKYKGCGIDFRNCGIDFRKEPFWR